jgi:hypothetical protein
MSQGCRGPDYNRSPLAGTHYRLEAPPFGAAHRRLKQVARAS